MVIEVYLKYATFETEDEAKAYIKHDLKGQTTLLKTI